MKDTLFDKLNNMNQNDKNNLLYRLFGLMETRGENGKDLSPDEFFKLIQRW